MDNARKIKQRLRTLARDSNTRLVGGFSIVWVIIVVCAHLASRSAGWVMIMVTQALILLLDVFIFVTLQEYCDGVIREPQHVQRAVQPMSSLGVIFRALEVVETAHVGSWFLALAVYVPAVLYDLGLFRRTPATIDPLTLWKDAEPLKFESRVRIGINFVLFFTCMLAMLIAVLGQQPYVISMSTASD